VKVLKAQAKIQMLSLYGVFISVFGLAALSKWSGGVPAWFIKQFESTILGSLPGGIALSFYVIALLETMTAFAFFICFTEEWRGRTRPEILAWAFALALVTFAVLGVGLRLSGDFTGAFQLFGYFCLTWIVSKKAPGLKPGA
jgi:hypothetical protein